MNSRARVTIKGTVQGVFFRASTESEALKLGLTGWVRNIHTKPIDKHDIVEALFEGDEEIIKGMIEWCRNGPRGAAVVELKTKWEEYQNEYETFFIQY